ncbi:unnamed protein product [Caenorhabditis auriculariae]|uniref:Uncharacterized protein n=1 Tax=Caenorhabditis auriculariae TaxID=2777116 RepID=A0A8S1HV98_9PELO|nr:unnamed protein product [Caenorhabditis auriculariae]
MSRSSTVGTGDTSYETTEKEGTSPVSTPSTTFDLDFLLDALDPRAEEVVKVSAVDLEWINKAKAFTAAEKPDPKSVKRILPRRYRRPRRTPGRRWATLRRQIDGVVDARNRAQDAASLQQQSEDEQSDALTTASDA